MTSPLPPEITEIELAENYPALRIETPLCTATVALHGAHLVHWQPHHTSHAVIYTSPTAVYKEGKAIRGGVPLCWPWFNAHPHAPDKHPSHGLARNRFWQLESCSVETDGVRITLSLPETEAIREHVPFPYQLQATFHLGRTCTIDLATKNLSPENQPVGGALHTYLALSHIDQVHLSGLQNTPFLDTTTEPEEEYIQREEPMRFAGEVDRIYFGTPNAVTLSDSDWKRQIVVSKENSLTTVVWNPWLEKATALGDMPDEGYQDFLCIEAANARQDTRLLAPGQSHHLRTTLEVKPLLKSL